MNTDIPLIKSKPTSYIIFCLDDPFDAHTVDLRYSGLVKVVGRYKGIVEEGYLCSTQTYESISAAGYTENQECVLRVTGCNKMYAQLVYLEDGVLTDRVEGLGCMHEVSKEEAMPEDGWTYRPDLDKYWVARKGNPDRVPPASGWTPEGRSYSLSGIESRRIGMEKAGKEATFTTSRKAGPTESLEQQAFNKWFDEEASAAPYLKSDYREAWSAGLSYALWAEDTGIDEEEKPNHFKDGLISILSKYNTLIKDS